MHHSLPRCVLLTSWGTVVTKSSTSGNLIHKKLDAQTNIEDCLIFHSENLRLKTEISGIGPFIIETENGISYLKSRDGYLTAHENGSVRIFQVLKNPWEKFLVLTEEEFKNLYFFISNSWFHEKEKITKEKDIEIIENFDIRVGDNTFYIPSSFIDNCNSFVCRRRNGYISEVILWLDSWMPYCYKLYKPLVYFCAFGEKYLDTLELSLQSLHEFGNYRGDIFIISDLSPDILKKYCPTINTFESHFEILYGQENLDFYTTRFRITEWKKIYQFSPLLYMDTDVIVDNNINSLLEDVFISDKMSAQEESFTTLQNSPSVGSDLFKIDKRFSEKKLDFPGFNSGIITVPDIGKYDITFNLIQSCIYRFSDRYKDRYKLSHFDQSIANYITLLTESIDLSILTEKVSYYWGNAIRKNDPEMPERNQQTYTGFVHFWGTGNRNFVMTKYMESIREGIPFKE